VAAAAGGADLEDLAALAEEMCRRCAPPDADGDGGFADRWLRLGRTFRDAGRAGGDLTPQRTAALRAVLEALGKKAGPEDTRTKGQRDHDALEEAGRRLVGSGCLPGRTRAGQPTQIQLHMTLDQLRGLDTATAAISLPLDAGQATEQIPAHLRRAVIARDRHCAFPGCRQRPAACQVHHIRPRRKGGRTSRTSLILLRAFHHLIAVHQWGWAVTLNPDGTVTATSPDQQRTLHSHSPPARAA
jgi:hypothetical protein